MDCSSDLQGSALAALTGNGAAPHGAQSIRELMRAVDEHIPAPQRSIDQPFAMPIEDVFAIQVLGGQGRAPACSHPRLPGYA